MEQKEFVEQVILNFVKGNEELAGLEDFVMKKRIKDVVKNTLDIRKKYGETYVP